MDKIDDKNTRVWFLFYFAYFLRIPDDVLKLWVNAYNEGFVCEEAAVALESIEQMTG